MNDGEYRDHWFVPQINEAAGPGNNQFAYAGLICLRNPLSHLWELNQPFRCFQKSGNQPVGSIWVVRFQIFLNILEIGYCRLRPANGDQ